MALPEYFKVWFKLFFRHPDIYIDATLNNCYGFFYPDVRMFWDGIESPNSGLNTGSLLTVMPDLYDKEFSAFDSYIDPLRRYVRLWEKNALTYPLCSIGTYSCITIYFLIWAVLKKKRKYLLLLIPGIISLLVCIASPTWWWNGFRYALPVVISVPFLTGLYMYVSRIELEEQEGDCCEQICESNL